MVVDKGCGIRIRLFWDIFLHAILASWQNLEFFHKFLECTLELLEFSENLLEFSEKKNKFGGKTFGFFFPKLKK